MIKLNLYIRHSRRLTIFNNKIKQLYILLCNTHPSFDDVRWYNVYVMRSVVFEEQPQNKREFSFFCTISQMEYLFLP